VGSDPFLTDSPGVTPLTIAEKYRLILPVSRLVSGAQGYAAVNADAEFNDPTHAAYQRTHHGLEWGFLLAPQRSGALRRVLGGRPAGGADPLPRDLRPGVGRAAEHHERGHARRAPAPGGGCSPVAGAVAHALPHRRRRARVPGRPERGGHRRLARSEPAAG